jgi:hypothetical protein
MAEHSETPDLVFVHLSDIHFREGHTGDAHDENRMLRNELQLDLRRLRSRLSRFDGLLVSGDIAYGGKPKEYEHASNWLKTICELVGCGREAVMITPGNHDIDRALIPLDGDVDVLHGLIRGAATDDRDDVLAEVLRDPGRGEMLLLPLSAYNTFAEQYGCRVTPDCPCWQRDFALRDGTTLRLYGLTTTLISGPRDNQQTRHKMVYGAAQQRFLREPNVRFAIIGHHPPSWTFEGDGADQVFSALTVFQAFGHKHEQWVTQLGNSVRLIAGAVHPDKHEVQWQPRYAAIAITTIDDRHLKLEIFPRRWSSEEWTFIPDFNSKGKDIREFTVQVEARQPN